MRVGVVLCLCIAVVSVNSDWFKGGKDNPTSGHDHGHGHGWVKLHQNAHLDHATKLSALYVKEHGLGWQNGDSSGGGAGGGLGGVASGAKSAINQVITKVHNLKKGVLSQIGLGIIPQDDSNSGGGWGQPQQQQQNKGDKGQTQMGWGQMQKGQMQMGWGQMQSKGQEMMMGWGMPMMQKGQMMGWMPVMMKGESMGWGEEEGMESKKKAKKKAKKAKKKAKKKKKKGGDDDDGWGKPKEKEPESMGWGMPEEKETMGWGMPQMMEMKGWGMPAQMETKGWGQQQQQQQQQGGDGWGTPVIMVMEKGQMMGWGMDMNNQANPLITAIQQKAQTVHTLKKGIKAKVTGQGGATGGWGSSGPPTKAAFVQKLKPIYDIPKFSIGNLVKGWSR